MRIKIIIDVKKYFLVCFWKRIIKEIVNKNSIKGILLPLKMMDAKKIVISRKKRERLDILSQAESYVGKYFSDAYVRKHILHFSEDDIERIQGEMDGEGHEDDSDGF